MPWIGAGLFGSPRAFGFDTCRPLGRQQGGCGDKGDEYCTCDELGSSIEGGYSEQRALHGLCSHNSSGYTECGAGTDLVAAGGLLSSLFL